MKIHHIPDWSRAEKGTTLTSFAICGQKTNGEDHWMAMHASRATCEECLRLKELSSG